MNQLIEISVSHLWWLVLTVSWKNLKPKWKFFEAPLMALFRFDYFNINETSYPVWMEWFLLWLGSLSVHMEKGSWANFESFLLLDCGWKVTRCSKIMLFWLAAIMDCTLDMSAEIITSLFICFFFQGILVIAIGK